MKNSLLVYAAIVCLAQGTDAATVTISAVEGQDVTFDCVSDVVTRLETPPGCIVLTLNCFPFRGPLKYLCRDECQEPLLQQYSDRHSNRKYIYDYMWMKDRKTLRVTILRLTSEDAGLYKCGMQSPTGFHISGQFRISVMAVTSPTSASFKPATLPPRTRSVLFGPRPLLTQNDTTALETTAVPLITDLKGISTNKQTSPEADTVVHAKEGQNIKIACPLKYLKFTQPPTVCLKNPQCLLYFHPVLYLTKKEGGDSSTIITQQDYAEYKRRSLKYGEESMTVGFTNLTKADSGKYVCGVQAASGNNSSSTFELIVDDAVTEGNRRLLLLLLIPALLLLMVGALLVLSRYKKRKSTSDLQRADTSDDKDVVMYENLPAPALQPADSTYQTLSADTRDHSQIYSFLNSPQTSPSTVPPGGQNLK